MTWEKIITDMRKNGTALPKCHNFILFTESVCVVYSSVIHCFLHISVCFHHILIYHLISHFGANTCSIVHWKLNIGCHLSTTEVSWRHQKHLCVETFCQVQYKHHGGLAYSIWYLHLLPLCLTCYPLLRPATKYKITYGCDKIQASAFPLYSVAYTFLYTSTLFENAASQCLKFINWFGKQDNKRQEPYQYPHHEEYLEWIYKWTHINFPNYTCVDEPQTTIYINGSRLLWGLMMTCHGWRVERVLESCQHRLNTSQMEIQSGLILRWCTSYSVEKQNSLGKWERVTNDFS